MCWGDNYYGQLGDGSRASRIKPEFVSGLTSGVMAISAGYGHSCALTTGGGVKCWGNNYNGELGDGTDTWRTTPVDVLNLASGVTKLTSGSDHTCILTGSGDLKCWGSNFNGELGDGTNTNRFEPVAVSGMSGALGVSAGVGHTCAINAGGGVQCWGMHIGNTPVGVPGLSAGVTAIDAGGWHDCAIVAGGAKCWGDNTNGQVGDGTHSNRFSPVDVYGLTSGVQQISAGEFHTCAITDGGTVRCWGAGYKGALGIGTTADTTTPQPVPGMTAGSLVVDAGASSTCALEASGAAKCWGENIFGQLGDGTYLYRPAPVDVKGLPLEIQAVAVGANHTCAILPGGGVNCWGDNSNRQLGIGSAPSQSLPVQVTGLSTGAVQIAAGSSHTCVRMGTGAVKCWGNNYAGQLGNGTYLGYGPGDVTALGTDALAITAGGGHSCALLTGGGVKCWGNNASGQLGDQTTQNRNAPVDVNGLTSGVLAVSAGDSHTCALVSGGGVKCWGSNWAGQLGDGTTGDKSAPVEVVGLGGSVVAVSAGGDFTCALLSTGAVQCWGGNSEGQLGDGTSTDSHSPVTVSGNLEPISAIESGDFHACALSQGGGLYCWGNNTGSQLGNGTFVNSPFPVAVSGLNSGVLAVRASAAHTCAIAIGGTLKCWGRDIEGQLGQGTVYMRTTPVYVVDAIPSDFLFLPFVLR
jgi:alpha-tubulin suppressor-like RCC1 family protein